MLGKHSNRTFVSPKCSRDELVFVKKCDSRNSEEHMTSMGFGAGLDLSEKPTLNNCD